MKNFGRIEVDPQTQKPRRIMNSETEERLNKVIDKVLNDINIGKYDVAVGEAVMSETMRKAQFEELKEFIQLFPEIINPQVVLEESTLPAAVKSRLLQASTPAQVQPTRGQPTRGQPNPTQTRGENGAAAL